MRHKARIVTMLLWLGIALSSLAGIDWLEYTSFVLLAVGAS